MFSKLKHPSLFLIPLIFSVLVLSLFFLALFNGWFGVSKDVGGCFCEQATSGLIKQPSNTWSNIGFIFSGLVMAWQLASGKFHAFKNRFTTSKFTAIFFSCLVILLGPCSMSMHATETTIGGELDMFSMYILCSFVVSYGMQRYFGWSNTVFTSLFIFIILICEVIGLYHEPIPVVDYAGNAIFGVFLIIGILFDHQNSNKNHLQFNRKFGVMSIASLALAFFIWNIWKDGSPLCDPSSLIQGHAIWHLLDALATYFLFRFYVSEHRIA